MAKLHILGSCSGTEPYPRRHHTSLVLEHNGTPYWFDAGECCVHTAYNMGIDVMKVREIFISHTHLDHMGGLANLLGVIRKLTIVRKQQGPFTVNIHIPVKEAMDAVLEFLKHTEGGFRCCFDIRTLPVQTGTLFKTEGLRVEALMNHHLLPDETGDTRSYSYRMTVEGKRIVFSGDVKSVDDLAPWLNDCDLLLMETGHHIASEVCTRLRSAYPGVHDVLFLHHGREILNDYEGAAQRAAAAWGSLPRIAEDAMTIEV